MTSILVGNKISTMMKSKITVFFVACAVCLALTEVFSLAIVHFARIQVPTDPVKFYQQLGSSEVRALDMTLEWKSGMKRFPLFGYVSSSGNNYGFMNKDDFPREKKKNEYVIGILGGSVASFLGAHLQNHPDFAEKLKKEIPDLKGKDIVILNLAVPGYKQPQQFHVFSYFMESLDAIVQVDGWNEAWISGSASYPVDFPAFSEVFYSDDELVRRVHSRLSKIKEVVASAAFHLGHHPWLAQSSALYLSIWSARSYLLAQGQDLTKLAKDFGVKKSFYSTPLSEDQEMESRIKSWIKYTKLENQIATQAGLKRMFFIQPSQYVGGAKIFSTQEKKKSLDGINRRATKIFERLRLEARNIANEVPIFDLNGLYSQENRDIFTDSCCHVNDLGNELMAEKIAAVLVKNWSRQLK